MFSGHYYTHEQLIAASQKSKAVTSRIAAQLVAATRPNGIVGVN